MTAPFAWSGKQLPDVAAWEDLRGDAPSWLRGVVVHHTWKPTLQSWRGNATMAGMAKHYRDKHAWVSGPHLFLACGSPNREDDGIWIGTPMPLQGTHATRTNRSHIGLEVVGNYDSAPWSQATRAQVIAVCGSILDWANLPVTHDTLLGHREVPSDKSCPGKANDMDVLRRDVAAFRADAPIAPIVGSADGTPEQLVNWLLPRVPPAYAARDVRAIINAYAEQGDALGVDWVTAVAQMVHETDSLNSFWSQRPQRNPAGIGVTGEHRSTTPTDRTHWSYNPQRRRWETGMSFSAWSGQSVPAHLGRLLAYALPDGDGTAVQRTAITDALAARPLPDRLRGSAPGWQNLNGLWAVPGVGYGERICEIAAHMRHVPVPIRSPA